MPHFPDEDIAAVQQRLLEGMRKYRKIAGDNCGYTDRDILQCNEILEAYLASLGGAERKTRKFIEDAVKNIVLKLNELNQKCEGSIIETDQREDICQIILVAARRAGLETEEDITEEWREW